MRIKDLSLSQLNNIFNELYKLQGAKEVFKSFDIELINKDTELQGVKELINSISKFLSENKEAKEFLEAFNYMMLEIQSKKAMIQSSEGMIKQLLTIQITTSEQTINMLEKQTKEKILSELLKLAKDNIINEKDLEEVEELIKENTIKDLSSENTYVSIKKKIEDRYANEKIEQSKEEQIERKEVSQNETIPNRVLDKIEEEDLVKDIISNGIRERVDTKEIDKKQEKSGDEVLNFDDFIDEKLNEKKQENIKKEEEEIDFLGEEALSEFTKKNNNDFNARFEFNHSNNELTF